jgi:hypothetical protein
MIDAMVSIIPADAGLFRNVVSKADEEFVKTKQKEAWEKADVRREVADLRLAVGLVFKGRTVANLYRTPVPKRWGEKKGAEGEGMLNLGMWVE